MSKVTQQGDNMEQISSSFSKSILSFSRETWGRQKGKEKLTD